MSMYEYMLLNQQENYRHFAESKQDEINALLDEYEDYVDECYEDWSGCIIPPEYSWIMEFNNVEKMEEFVKALPDGIKHHVHREAPYYVRIDFYQKGGNKKMKDWVRRRLLETIAANNTIFRSGILGEHDSVYFWCDCVACRLFNYLHKEEIGK